MTMSKTAFLYAAPSGVPGDITRPDDTVVEPAMLIAVASVFAQAFGIPMVYVTGGISQYSTGKVAADFAGVLARSAPEISGDANNQDFADCVPYAKQVQNLVTRGYVNVACVLGTPARGGIVYIRVVASAGHVIGDFDATTDADNVALSLTQASWASDGKDADNNAELRIAR